MLSGEGPLKRPPSPNHQNVQRLKINLPSRGPASSENRARKHAHKSNFSSSVTLTMLLPIDDLSTTILTGLSLLVLVYNADILQWLYRQRRQASARQPQHVCNPRIKTAADKFVPPPTTTPPPLEQRPKRIPSVRFSDLTVTSCDSLGSHSLHSISEHSLSPCHRTVQSVSLVLKRKLTRKTSPPEHETIQTFRRRRLRSSHQTR